MGGHHRGRHAIAVCPTDRQKKGSSSVTGSSVDAFPAGRHRAQPEINSLDDFNRAESAAAREMLRTCLDVPQWAAEVAGGRPYPDAVALAAAGAAAASAITWEQVAAALDRHPRIGERQAVAAGTAAETKWSSTEQSGVQQDQTQALARANQVYEQRFGHIFLICASGLTGEQILDDLHRRLAHDPAVERTVVMTELRKIAALRLAKAVSR